MSPCRVMDTRQGQGFTDPFGPPSIAAGLPVRTIPIQSSATCSIPPVAQAYSLNVTVVPPGSLLYLTLYPATADPQPAPPNASTLNDPTGTIIANAAIVPAGTDGQGSVNVFASSATDLIVDINGYYAPPGSLQGNMALGTGALAGNSTGYNNTAIGNGAMGSNTTGANNAATGFGALGNNTTGTQNAAMGANALQFNSTGANNTATGASALWSNTTGGNNTATGSGALLDNTTGSSNTAIGNTALQNNTTGAFNTASGNTALENNRTGCCNTAAGSGALRANTTGGYNTADGGSTLYGNTTGSNNVASGFNALFSNTTGNNNIAIGYNAASNVSAGNSNNIHIGSQGAAADSGTIRIGTPATQTSFFAAGIRGATTGNNDAIPVVIDSAGQLGTVSSSARFKEDIHDMADASSALLELRPVTFRYQHPFADGSKPIQFGLIAEEVEKVYPGLVAHSADGQIESVMYQVLDSMLLNELQKQAATNRQQAEEIRLLKERLAAIEALLPGVDRQ